MDIQLIGITLLWGFIFIYAVMASMDFGAGFWSMIFLKKEKTKATNIANRYLSPTWEVTNVFIVAIVVASFSLFPTAAFTVGTVLFIPGSIILLLLSLRSSFLVFSHVVQESYEKILTVVTGITGILIPVFLICVLPITQGSFIDKVNGNPQLNMGKLFSSPNVYAFIGFALCSTLFLSSLLLADYSKQADEERAYSIYYRAALITGPLLLIMSLLVVFTMKYDALWLYNRLLDHMTLLVLSVIMFIIAGIALLVPDRKRDVLGRPRIAVVAITIQYFLASYAYGKAHLPYVVYPNVTIANGFTNPDNFRAMFITYIVGFIILFPGFFFFWRMFMKDQRYLKQKPE